MKGYSSVERKEQTKHRLPDCLANCVYRRSDLNKIFTEEIKNKSNDDGSTGGTSGSHLEILRSNPTETLLFIFSSS